MKPPPESSMGASIIALEVFRLYPHIALIFGRVFLSIEFNCFLDRNDCPSVYSTDGLYTVLYIILFSFLVQLHLDMLSTIDIAFSSTLDAWMNRSPPGDL